MQAPRTTRYQAAILRGHQILLIKHRHHADGRTYWLLPGGGIEAGETEIECISREVREETNLEVTVESLLLDELAPHEEKGLYQRFKTYLCRPMTGQAAPGYEPELEAAALYAIVEVGWFNLQDETTWNELILNDPITSSGLRRIRKALSVDE